MRRYLTYILLLLCFASGGYFLFLHNRLPSKEDFYAKHHIENNSIMSLFDESECRRVFSELYNEKYADDLLKSVKEDMALPELYEGFCFPKNKVRFYNARYKENILRLGLTEKDIKKLGLEVTADMLKKWYMGMSETELEQSGFYSALYTARLVAKVGENIYLFGDYADCGTDGCQIQTAVKNNDIWTFPRIDIGFASCIANKDKSKYECDIVGGHSVSWRSAAADYKPLDELLSRYYEIYADYVQQYLQKKK